MTLLEWFERVGVEYLEAGRGEVRLCCLQCEDSKFHLYVNPQKGVFHCFKCGWGGSLRRLIEEIRGIYHCDLEGLVLELAGEVPSEDEETKPPLETVLPAGYYPLTEHGPGRELALEYLRKRGVDFDTVSRYRLGYCNMGKFGGRIIFPITFQGKVVSYVGRDILNRVPKVLTPSVWEADPPSRYLYNFDQARFFPRVVITEGVFDCLTLQVVDGETCAVASFGKHLTSAQIDLLLRERFSEVIFSWDGDALPEAVKSASLLVPFVPVRVVILPDGEDPNSLGRERMKDYLASAVDLGTAELRCVEASL